MKNLITAPFRLLDEIMSKILIFRKSTQKKILLICIIISAVLASVYLIVYTLLGKLKYSILLSLITMVSFYCLLYKVVDSQVELKTKETINLGSADDETSEDYTGVKILEVEEVIEEAKIEIAEEEKSSKLKTYDDYSKEELANMSEEDKLAETLKLSCSADATAEELANSIQFIEMQEFSAMLDQGNFIEDDDDDEYYDLNIG